MNAEQKNFIEVVGAIASTDMKNSGVAASLTIAQAILESAWGKSELTKQAMHFLESRLQATGRERH